MVIFHILMYVLMALVVVMYYVNAGYRRKKQQEYGNDERWKSIVIAASMVVRRYNIVLLALAVLGYGASRMFDFGLMVSLHNVFGLLLLILLSGSIVEFTALLIYDRKM